MRFKITGLIFLFSALFYGLLPAQDNLDSLYLLGHQKHWSEAETARYRQWAERHFMKPSAGSVRQDAIMNGNKITSVIWNFGSISPPNERIVDIVWEGLGYGYEFGPFVAAEVEVFPGDPHPDIIRIVRGLDTTYIAHIISDGLTSNGGEISPDGNYRWGWQPLVPAKMVRWNMPILRRIISRPVMIKTVMVTVSRIAGRKLV